MEQKTIIKKEEVDIKSVEKEKLEEIMREYEQDPDNFYLKNFLL